MGIKGDRAVWEAQTEGIEFLNVTIGNLLDQQAENIPDREALVFNHPEFGINVRLNFRQYQDEANKVAKGLLALGIQKGDHVALWSPNLPQWVLLQLALAKIGAVLVTLNTFYRTAEVEYALHQGDISTLFLTEEFRGNSFLEALYNIAPEIKQVADPIHEEIQSARLPRLKRAVLIGKVHRPGLLRFDEMVALGQNILDETLRERQAGVSPDDTALIMYTSGTTGFPKGAMLSHRNLLNSRRHDEPPRDYSEERGVSPMPLFHIAGLMQVLSGIVNGNTLVQMVGFDPARQLELMSSERATVSGGVPTMLIAMLNHPRFIAGEFDLSHLRRIGTAAAAVPVVLMEQVKARMNADCSIAYGQTEASGAITVTLDEDTFELKSSTVGKPLTHLDVKIINPATGEPVGFGEAGELWARGCTVMSGYYNMPEKTAEAIDSDGWLHTGDLATMDEQGYVRIVGRLKEMIIRGGENIYPAEIEAFLMRHPKLAEAQVLGLPDVLMGEEAVALLRLKPGEEATEEEIRQYCAANISKFKIPRYIRFVNEYPMTASGKVKKFELRAQLIKELGLEEAAKIKTA